MVFARACVTVLLTHSIVLGNNLTAVKNLYYKAVDGDKNAGALAASQLEVILRSRPDDALVLAYRGSVFLLQSSWTMAPWQKGKLAKAGLEMMDRAVALSPKNVEVRFVRAATTMRLPGVFRRGEQSEADFAEITPYLAEAVRMQQLEPRIASAALHFHALNRDKAGDPTAARDACRLAIAIAPATPGADACGSKLATHPSRSPSPRYDKER